MPFQVALVTNPTLASGQRFKASGVSEAVPLLISASNHKAKIVRPHFAKWFGPRHLKQMTGGKVEVLSLP